MRPSTMPKPPASTEPPFETSTSKAFRETSPPSPLPKLLACTVPLSVTTILPTEFRLISPPAPTPNVAVEISLFVPVTVIVSLLVAVTVSVKSEP